MRTILVLAQDGQNTRTLLDYVRDGGPIGYFIILLSLVGLAFAIANVIRLRRAKFVPPVVHNSLEQLLAANDVQGAIAYCRRPESDSYLTRVVGASLLRCSRSPFGLLELRGALEESGQVEVERMYRYTDAIGLIASVAPMLGLLGTVLGLVGAFHTVGVDEGARRSQELATYMSLALVTTAEGLCVAIPATAAYAFFRRRIDKLAAESGDALESIIATVQASSGAAPRPAARPGAPVAARPPVPLAPAQTPVAARP